MDTGSKWAVVAECLHPSIVSVKNKLNYRENCCQ